MGIGGAFIFPTTLSILTNTFSGRERARAIGIWAGVAGLGIVIGPLGGGLLLEHFWWGSVFLVNVPISLDRHRPGIFFVPDSRDPEESRLDPIGALLSIAMLGPDLFGIIEAPDLGWGDPQVVASIAAGLALLGVFIWWELHTTHADARPPLLPEPAVLGRVRHDHAHLLRALRLDVPAHAVLPVRARLLAAEGRDDDRASRHRHHGLRAAGAEVRRPLRHQARGRHRAAHRGHRAVLLRLRHRHVVVHRRHPGAHHLRRRHGPHDGTGDRVDHGIAAPWARPAWARP